MDAPLTPNAPSPAQKFTEQAAAGKVIIGYAARVSSEPDDNRIRPSWARVPRGTLPTLADRCEAQASAVGPFAFMAIRLAEDHDEMRAMALGERPFKPDAIYERLAEHDPRELLKALTPGERLSLGYYLAARWRAAQMAEG